MWFVTNYKNGPIDSICAGDIIILFYYKLVILMGSSLLVIPIMKEIYAIHLIYGYYHTFSSLKMAGGW